MTGFTIGQLAEEAGVGVETIRFYQARGLLVEPPKPSRGYRRYPAEQARRIRFIRKAQALGFSLREVLELLSLSADPHCGCGDIQAQAQAKLKDVENKLEDLQRVREALLELLSACSGEGPLSGCPILDALEEGPHAAH